MHYLVVRKVSPLVPVIEPGTGGECLPCVESVEIVEGKQLNSKTNNFQLQELHVYLVPGSCWQQGRNLATKTIENDTISLGFVR